MPFITHNRRNDFNILSEWRGVEFDD